MKKFKGSIKKEDSAHSWINEIIPYLGLNDFNGIIDIELTVESDKVTKINLKDKKPLK